MIWHPIFFRISNQQTPCIIISENIRTIHIHSTIDRHSYLSYKHPSIGWNYKQTYRCLIILTPSTIIRFQPAGIADICLYLIIFMRSLVSLSIEPLSLSDSSDIFKAVGLDRNSQGHRIPVFNVCGARGRPNRVAAHVFCGCHLIQQKSKIMYEPLFQKLTTIGKRTTIHMYGKNNQL